MTSREGSASLSRARALSVSLLRADTDRGGANTQNGIPENYHGKSSLRGLPTSLPEASNAPVVVASMLPSVGTTGVQTHVRQVCEYLAARGHDPRLVTPFSWGGPLAFPVFGVRRAIDKVSQSMSVAWYRHWHYVFLRRALRRTLAPMRSAVIYAQCPLSALAALEVRRDPSQRVVIAIHFNGSQADEWVDKKKIREGGRSYRAMAELERLVLPMVDGIVYVSDHARRSLVGRVAEVERVRSAVIPNFISRPTVASTRPTSDLVTVGGLEIAKNHRYLLEVLHAANEMGRCYTLDVVGSGPCREPLERLSRSLGLDDQVRWLGARADVLKLLPNYRAYVHASTRESLCLSIIEAMGSGLAVLAGGVGGIPELFTTNVEGIFWPLDDPQAAARLLIDLLEDLGRLARVSAAARSRFERSFDAGVLGPVLEQFLESTLYCEQRHDQRAPDVA